MPTSPTPRVRYYAAQSLDGYIAESDHTIAWLLEHDTRTRPADDAVGGDAVGGGYERFLDGIGALVVGARTCEYVLGEGAGCPYPGRPMWVLSHQHLPVPDGADVRVGALPAVEAARRPGGRRRARRLGHRRRSRRPGPGRSGAARHRGGDHRAGGARGRGAAVRRTPHGAVPLCVNLE